jgi:lipoyl(octanoyl) transferase
MSIFATLDVYYDESSRSAASNMAIDEALLELATQPTIRFYQWDHPALSFGYFGRFADVENEARDLVRRWTGGGIVLHGEDLTYSLVIPANDEAFNQSSMSIYEKIHNAVRAALGTPGVTVAALYERRLERNSAVTDRRYNKELCFANPVEADVILNGRKVAGAAQRRARSGLLQQGSIQNVDLGKGFADLFANQLCGEYRPIHLDDRLLARAQQIAEQKYATKAWLQRR